MKKMNENQQFVVDKMKEGYELIKSWSFVGHDIKDTYHLIKNKDWIKVDGRTFKSLLNKGVIAYDRNWEKYDGKVMKLVEIEG